MERLETSRLMCIKFTLEDGPFILQLVNDSAWIDNIGDRNIHTPLDAHSYLDNGPFRLYAAYGYGPLKVILKETGEPIGMAGLFKRDELEHTDLVIILVVIFCTV
jgi:ribosomal-protein-alanine N-acetyltransferase